MLHAVQLDRACDIQINNVNMGSIQALTDSYYRLSNRGKYEETPFSNGSSSSLQPGELWPSGKVFYPSSRRRAK